MKIIALVILIVGYSSGLGSGPYLPSGWKPSGPAFYLPTEIEKPAAVSVEASISQETETSGSSFLKEYGPPKVEVAATETSDSDSLQEYEKSVEVSEVLQDITQQALPEPITEQAFVETNAVQENLKSAEISEEVSQVTLTEETATTDSEADTEAQTATEAAIEGKTAEVEDQTESSLPREVTEEKTEETQETENANSNLVSVEQKIEEEVTEGKAVKEVKNIAEALINLENEVKAQEVQAIQEVTEVKTVQESSRSLQAPEGFLEYGPPGFTEYGPPKGNLRTEVAAEENSESALQTNETRRRRFSPKFKASNRKH